jgi:hypothetical protein
METTNTQQHSWIVVESTPGYMPESEPAEFLEYADAVAYANELADELEEQGYTTDRGWASSGNYLAIKAERSDTVAPDLGRFIAVERDEREEEIKAMNNSTTILDQVANKLRETNRNEPAGDWSVYDLAQATGIYIDDVAGVIVELRKRGNVSDRYVGGTSKYLYTFKRG